MGGRAFKTHYFYNFFASQAECAAGPDPISPLTCQGQGMLPMVGTWEGNKGLPFAPKTNCPNDLKIPSGAGGPGSCMTIDTTIPKGKSFADWYSYNNAKLTVGGGEANG